MSPAIPADARASILVVTGMRREAATVTAEAATVVLSGADRVALKRRLAALGPGGYTAVVSFGLAGALDPALAVGAVVVADLVVDEAGQRYATSPGLTQAVRESLSASGLQAVRGAMFGADRPLLTPPQKSLAGRLTGAVAVDMESHLAAAFAAEHGLPFAILRVISDDSSRALPAIVGQIMRTDGSIDFGRLVRGLVRNPGQIRALIATGRNAGAAFRQLRCVGSLLDGRLGLHL